MKPEEVGRAVRQARSQPTPALQLMAFQRLIKRNSVRLGYYHLFLPAGKLALQVGKLDMAERYANKLLRTAKDLQADPKRAGRLDWNRGNALYHGHTLLGLVALKRGNVKLAVQHLRLSATTPGSPQLGSRGPDLGLAKELLAHRKVRAVTEFLKKCKRFWKHGGPLLDGAARFAQNWAHRPGDYVLQYVVDDELAAIVRSQAVVGFRRRYRRLAAKYGKGSQGAPLPIPRADADRVIQVGALTGLLEHCDISWRGRFHTFMKSERGKPWTKRQVTFIAILHGVSQGTVARSAALLQCTDAVFAALRRRMRYQASWWLAGKCKKPRPADFMSTASTSGGLSAETVRRVVRAHLSEIKNCYMRKGLPANPQLRGVVKVSFTVNLTGAVEQATVSHSTMMHAPTESCFVEAVRRWRFPEPKGAPARIEYPFHFKPKCDPCGRKP